MPTEPKPDRGKGRRMSEPPARPPRPGRAAGEPAEMQARKDVAQAPEGYLRLRLRVEDGQVSVVGAKAVEGPLVQHPRLHGALAYEVTLGGKRLAAGAIPDAGERRSFPALEGPPELRGHHVSALPSYEVAVRVPRAKISKTALPRLEIALFRVKEEVPHVPAGDTPLAQLYERELREVARVKGIRTSRLPRPVQEELERAIG